MHVDASFIDEEPRIYHNHTIIVEWVTLRAYFFTMVPKLVCLYNHLFVCDDFDDLIHHVWVLFTYYPLKFGTCCKQVETLDCYVVSFFLI